MKNLLIAMMLTLSVSLVNAQQRGPGGTPEERAKAQVERLEKDLKLTATQKDSIYKWSIEQSKEAQALFQSSGEDREQARTKLTALRTKTDKKITSILDDTQKAKYAEIQKEEAARRPGGSGGRPRGDN